MNISEDYELLCKSLSRLLSDEAEPEYSVERQVVLDAVEMALDMMDNSVRCPKFFTHGGDAIAFIWEGTGLLTIGDSQIAWSDDPYLKSAPTPFDDAQCACLFIKARIEAKEK